jgi:glycosyltransferase involved in cell wall biosynthesis
MKILFVTSDRFPPFRPAAKAIFGEELAGRGHKIDWVMPAGKDAGPARTQEFAGGIAYLAPYSGRKTRAGRLLRQVREVLNELRVIGLARRNSYDIIQVKDLYLAALIAWLAARLTGSKFCFWLAYPHPESNLYNARLRLARYPILYWIRGHLQSITLYRFLLPNADHVFVQSEQMREDIGAKGIPHEKMTPVPGSLNLSDIPYRGQDDPGPAGENVLYVGTLLRKRRLDFIVRAFARVAGKRPGARLVFVGGGENPEDEQLLLREVESCNLQSKVEFTGKVPMSEVWKHIEKAAVCLSPYYPTFVLNSTSPTKLIEYMAMARPVVANDHPEQSKVIADSEAGICVPWDEDRFAEAINELLEKPDMAREMGTKGRKWVAANRTNSLMADLVESRYSDLLHVPGAAIASAARNPDAE